MKKELKIYGEFHYNGINSFFLFIMSHGTEERIYNVNGDIIKFKTVLHYFSATSCPGLARKPRIFFSKHVVVIWMIKEQIIILQKLQKWLPNQTWEWFSIALPLCTLLHVATYVKSTPSLDFKNLKSRTQAVKFEII